MSWFGFGGQGLPSRGRARGPRRRLVVLRREAPPQARELSRVVRGLVEAGTDFRAIHRLDHFFGGAPPSLKEVETILRERGLSDVSPSSGGLTLRQELPLDVDLITTWTQRSRCSPPAQGAATTAGVPP